MKLARVPPVGMPAMVITTFRMLFLPPSASEVRAIRLGRAPPSPRPQAKRIASSAP